jgi:sugar lactone lactonase YvrE
MMQPGLLLDARADLGEGPAWDAGRNCLYWVDIHAGDLHIFRPEEGTDTCVNLGETVGCVAPCQSGDLVIALRGGFASLNLTTQKLTRLATLEQQLPGNRFNDGKCDPVGRFLAGTMDDAEKEASGTLYSFSPSSSVKTLLSGIRISNGLTWSPDHKTFYHIDTPSHKITAFDYDLASGEIDNPRIAIAIPAGMGWPDGMTSDSGGTLWVAMWAGAKITRWNPATGKLVETIPVPALNITSCIFGGPYLNDLYITSARKGVSADQLKEYPASGGLFRIKTKTQGMPTFAFGR